MADSDEDFDSAEEDSGEEVQSPTRDRSKKDGGDFVLAGPRPLYHEREDVDWEEEMEDVTPQTGTKIRLMHPPPSFVDIAVKEEPLNPPNPLSISNPDEHLKIMGRAKEAEKPPSKDLISTSGYPIGVGGTLVYDAMELNAQRKASKPEDCQPFYKVEDADDKTLVFESLFESGNLYQAYRTGPFEYDLVLRNDFNTNGHTQWYYFRVSNTKQNEKYRFNIINMYKKSSMYNRGLRPLIYSEKLAAEKKAGWHRGGTDIVYVKNNFYYQKARAVHPYYSLSFTMSFPASGDACYLAHCFPYTYSDLQQYLQRLDTDPDIRKVCRRRLLCRSVAGNRCDLLTITSGNTVEVDTTREAQGRPRKPCVVLSARVHPGESNASWIILGCIEFLISSAPEAVALREQCVFKVVPMLNPDGVILGNYRTGLAGSDLNRKWKSPDQAMHPTIFFMRQMMERMRDERKVAMFVDMHGHSVKNNAFLYGCDARFWGQAPNHPSRKTPHEYECRIFPAQLDHLCSHFSLRDCRFHAKRKKEVSARVVCWRQITPLSYTLEASFGGADGNHSPPSTHFSPKHFKRIGLDVCMCIHDLLCQDESKVEALKAALIKKLEAEPIPDDGDSDDEGSTGERDESDDDSDDDTVENLVLPQTVVEKLTAKPKSKPKARRASVSKIKKDVTVKKEEKAELEKKDSVKDKPPEKPAPLPVKKESIKLKDPEPKPPPPEPEPATPPVCTCPSCQVYEQFIKGTIGSGVPGLNRRSSSKGSVASASTKGGGASGSDDAISRTQSAGSEGTEGAQHHKAQAAGEAHRAAARDSAKPGEREGAGGPGSIPVSSSGHNASGSDGSNAVAPEHAPQRRGGGEEAAQSKSGVAPGSGSGGNLNAGPGAGGAAREHGGGDGGLGVGPQSCGASQGGGGMGGEMLAAGGVNYHPSVVAQQLLRSVGAQGSGSGAPPGAMAQVHRSTLSAGVRGGSPPSKWDSPPSDRDNLKAGPGGRNSVRRLGGASAGPVGGVSRITRKY